MPSGSGRLRGGLLMIEQLRPAAHREQVQHRAHGKRPLACGPLFIDGAVHIERALMHLATLAVAGAGVAAAAVDLLHKHPNFGQAQGETSCSTGPRKPPRPRQSRRRGKLMGALDGMAAGGAEMRERVWRR